MEKTFGLYNHKCVVGLRDNSKKKGFGFSGIHLSITPKFEWNDRWNGKNEPFWIMVDNDSEILHSEFFLLHKKDV